MKYSLYFQCVITMKGGKSERKTKKEWSKKEKKREKMLRVNHKPVDDADFLKNFFLGNSPESTCAEPGTECFHYIHDCYNVPVVFAFDPSQVSIFFPGYIY